MAFADTRPRECIDHTQGHYWSICWFTPYRAQRVYHQIPSPTLLVNLPIHSLGGVLTNTIPRTLLVNFPIHPLVSVSTLLCNLQNRQIPSQGTLLVNIVRANYYSQNGKATILTIWSWYYDTLTMMSPTMNRTTMRIMIMILMLLTLITMQSICFGMIERSQVGSDVRPWRIQASSPDCQYWSTPRWWWWWW